MKEELCEKRWRCRKLGILLLATSVIHRELIPPKTVGVKTKHSIKASNSCITDSLFNLCFLKPISLYPYVYKYFRTCKFQKSTSFITLKCLVTNTSRNVPHCATWKSILMRCSTWMVAAKYLKNWWKKLLLILLLYHFWMPCFISSALRNFQCQY